MIVSSVDRKVLGYPTCASPASFSKHLGPDRGVCNKYILSISCYLVQHVLTISIEADNLLGNFVYYCPYVYY